MGPVVLPNMKPIAVRLHYSQTIPVSCRHVSLLQVSEKNYLRYIVINIPKTMPNFCLSLVAKTHTILMQLLQNRALVDFCQVTLLMWSNCVIPVGRCIKWASSLGARPLMPEGMPTGAAQSGTSQRGEGNSLHFYLILLPLAKIVASLVKRC